MKALRHTKTGDLYPMNEHLAKHEDIEFVELDENMKVIEPEEVGPAAELTEESSTSATGSVGDTASAETKPATRSTRKKTAAEDQ